MTATASKFQHSAILKSIYSPLQMNQSLEKEMELILSEFPLIPYKLNEVLFTPTHASHNIFYIKVGRVKVVYTSTKNREIVSSYYQKGDFVNLECLSDDEQKRLSGISKSKNTIVVRIRREQVEQLTLKSNNFQKAVIRQLLSDKTERENRLKNLLEMKSSHRVFNFIFQHAQKVGRQVGYEVVVNEPLTHNEIADYVCASRQTVTVALNILRDNGILHFNRRYWIIRNMGKLEQVIQEDNAPKLLNRYEKV